MDRQRGGIGSWDQSSVAVPSQIRWHPPRTVENPSRIRRESVENPSRIPENPGARIEFD